MKKLLYTAVFLQLSISSLLLADPNVVFNDSNLEEAVAEALGLTVPITVPITESQMLNLLSLTASGKSISDLTGLDYATNVIFLNLNDNQITDISALEFTTDVNELYLESNLLSDPNVLLPISGLTSLINLYLNDNQITDISAVENLENLDTLFLSINLIDDLTPVSGLTGLTSLYLQSNLIDDISSLSGLSNLTLLDLTDNLIVDISVVPNLTSLELLYLADNQIGGILPDMSSLTSLQILHLTNNAIEDLFGLTGEEPNDLTSLLLSGNITLNKVTYCTYLDMIKDNNPPGLTLVVDEGLWACLDHDICSDAIEVFKDVPYSDTTVGATGPEEESVCGVDDWKDVWHFYTPISDEVVNIDLCGSSLDTSLVVFDSCPDTGGTVLACNDDFNDGFCGAGSLVTVSLTGGQTYMIRVAGYSAPTNGTGPYELFITDAPAPPANNTCDDAIEIFQYDDPIIGSTLLAYGTDITSCTASDTRDVWYYFNPIISGLYLIDPDPNSTGDYSATLAVFDGCGGNELTCNDLYCNFDRWDYCDIYKSRIIVSLDNGQTYYIRVAGYAGKGGDYKLKVTLAADIDQDGVVDMDDLIWLVQEWMQEGTSYADIAPEGADGGGDKFIDLWDTVALYRQWDVIVNP